MKFYILPGFVIRLVREKKQSTCRIIYGLQELIDWLKDRGEGFAVAFSDPSLVRVAVNQEYATLDKPISQGDEVAFFPPVTGNLSIRVQQEDFDVGMSFKT